MWIQVSLALTTGTYTSICPDFTKTTGYNNSQICQSIETYHTNHQFNTTDDELTHTLSEATIENIDQTIKWKPHEQRKQYHMFVYCTIARWFRIHMRQNNQMQLHLRTSELDAVYRRHYTTKLYKFAVSTTTSTLTSISGIIGAAQYPNAPNAAEP